jgi:hypothetical protein
MLSTDLHLVLPSGLFPSGFPTNILYALLVSPIRATCPGHLILLEITVTVTTEHNLLYLWCLHGDGSQQCPLVLCSPSYRLGTTSQLTHCSNCRLSTNCPGCNISARTAQKTPFLCFQLLPCKHACLEAVT